MGNNVKVHIIGGGLAGLACAVGLRCRKFTGDICIYDASNHLGGRCSSLYIPSFTKEIDIGTHMILKANTATEKYLREIGANYNFFEYQPKLIWEKKGITPLFKLFLRSIFNTSQSVPLPLIFETLKKAIKAPYPLFPHDDLKKGFIEPFIRYASLNQIDIKLNYRLTGFTVGQRLSFLGKESIELGKNDKVVLALPVWAISMIFQDIPEFKMLRYNAITNVHFLLGRKYSDFAFSGVVGGYGDWFRLHNDVLSVTISDVKTAVDRQKIYEQAKKVFSHLADKYEQSEVITDRAATISQDKANLLIRDKLLTKLSSMGIKAIGDWTVPTLPCTIEAAITSGLSYTP